MKTKKKEKQFGEGRPVEDREKVYCPSCKTHYDVYSAGEGGTCPKCGGEPGVKKVNGKGKAKARKAVVHQKKAQKQKGKEGKKEKEAKKPALKYPFDTLDKEKSFTIPNANGEAGKVTIYENIKILAREYGQRHGMKFQVKRTDDGQVECTRIK